jgi:AcrR family transcriptional regulator
MPRPRAFDDRVAIDAVVDEFWDRGYHATSTDELCQRTALSRSSLYNAFGKKRDVYLRALEQYAAERQRLRDAVLEGEEPGREALREFFRSVLDEQWADERRRVCFMINASVEVGPCDEDVRRLLAANADRFRQMIAELVRRGQRDGSIRDDMPAERLAATLHATLDGLQVQGRAREGRDDIDAAVETLLALL